MTSPAGKPTGPPDPHLMRFLESLEQLDEKDGLFRSALLISAIENPTLTDGWWDIYLREIDRLADEARHALGTFVDPLSLFENLLRFFCEDLGYRGETDDYHAPRNSCLTHVLLDRHGLPITLSVVLVTLGRRLGMDLYGVGAPGHFIVGALLGTNMLYADPFTGASVLERDEAIRHVSQISSVPADYVEQFLEPSPHLGIIARMLNNLKVSYLQRDDMDRLLSTLDWLVAMNPDNPTERRNRGLVNLRVGQNEEGAQDLLRYLELTDEPEDLDMIHREVQRALKKKNE